MRAHGAISTCVPVHSAEPHADPSRKPTELGGFRFPAKSPAAGHLSMHTVSSYLRGQGHFEMPGGVFSNIAQLLLLPLGLAIGDNLCYALMEAAAIVRYWRIHLQVFLNAIGLSDMTKRYASKNDLPLTILQETEILPALRAFWKDLREVHQSAREHKSKWLHERTGALASQMKTDRSKAVRQIAAENATKTMV